ncbi:MAG: transglutaminase domain-containing protein [Pseudomonadota bacterium]
MVTDRISQNTPRLERLSPGLYRGVIAIRAVWVLLLTVLINALLPLGTPPVAVTIAGILGVAIASRLAHSRLTSLGATLLAASSIAALVVGAWILQVILGATGATSFIIDRVALHSGTCLISALLWGVSTWIFWRVRAAATLEVLAIFTLSILLFASHRDFHLDRPRFLNSVAWRLGLDHLSMLVIVGTAILALAMVYLYFASLAVRPRAEGASVRVTSPGKRVLYTALVAGLLSAAIYGVQSLVYRYYNATMLARVSNGVGMNDSPGMSPLSFESALGSTNQPAALVRLEGDYANNPFSPMMYLRESALSSFNGKEMVFAGRAYDTDLPTITARESFTRKEDTELGLRTPLIQSIYLLADHEHAFAVDYPVSINQLKNPRPNRFKATYRAYSVAPAYPLKELSAKNVGDPRWTPEIKRHYLTPHTDQRYAQTAQEITKDSSTPLDKMKAITDHLSRTAIYTLTPNHAVKPGDDPVAAFLFGDHRGYCVHFAHAIVYMARSLGIPARIGTGYLTDLSQAKDGHILLRMSDRHAWAEAFVEGIGWVPFDVQPDQVESHAESQVDAKLLEELMGVLEPGEEILPKDSARDEPGMNDSEGLWLPDQTQTALIILAILASIICSKLALLHGWKIAPNSKLALRWAYISIAARLHDLGITRQYGETRLEFAQRAPYGLLSQLSNLVADNSYAPSPNIPRQRVQDAVKQALNSYANLPKRARLLAAINPGSLVRAISGLITGGSW